MRRARGGQPRVPGDLARNRLVVLLTDNELAQVDSYVERRGHDRSYWVRRALELLGMLKRKRDKR